VVVPSNTPLPKMAWGGEERGGAVRPHLLCTQILGMANFGTQKCRDNLQRTFFEVR